jgi:hypothetical protein
MKNTIVVNDVLNVWLVLVFLRYYLSIVAGGAVEENETPQQCMWPPDRGRNPEPPDYEEQYGHLTKTLDNSLLIDGCI